MSEFNQGDAAGRMRSAVGSGGALEDRVRSLRLPRKPAAGGNVAWLLPWMLSAALLLALVWSLLPRSAPPALATTDPQAAADPIAPSSTAPAAAPSAKSGDVVLESKGYIIPAHQILVSPKVNGMVTELFIEEGQRVKKGDILARIEDVDYQADVRAAAAQLASARQRLLELENGARPEEIGQAKAELAEAQAQLPQLQAEWQRNLRLLPTKAVADREFELSQSQYRAMERKIERLKLALALLEEGPRKERVEAAREEVRLAEAELRKATWRLENCTIRAPVSGTILKKNAEEGNIVNPIAFNGSYSLCEMADLADLEVELPIQERDVSRVFKGQICKVRAEAFPDRAYDGVVSRVMPIADRAKGAVPVRVKLTVPAEEEGVYLKPEMGAVVSFLKAPGS